MTNTHAADLYPTSEEVKGIIFLDPGHGGYETGTEYKRRVEKEDTLALGLLIRQELQKRGYQVEMSRTDDEYLSRRERATLANRSGAGLMISLHRNKGVKGQGFAAYIQSADRKQDRILGKNIMKQIEKVGVSTSNGVQPGMPHDSGRDFTENRFSNMPSALIVFGYINNKKDNQLFDQHLEEYAAAVAKGIDKTYNKLYR
jgi:N-acetylmuramoyl-L-alanine amidase